MQVQQLVQVYSPTAEKSEQDIEEFHESLAAIIKKANVIGDFNAKVGQCKTLMQDSVTEAYRLEKRGTIVSILY